MRSKPLPSTSSLLLLIAVLACPAPAQAGWISEVFLGQASDQGMPNAIELSNLPDAGDVELLIMEAGHADQFGEILKIVLFQASQPLHLISDGDWPETPWTEMLPDLPAGVMLDLAGLTDPADARLDLAGARRIHLYHGHTDIQPDGLNPLHETYGPLLQGDAELLDVITLTATGHAETQHPDEAVLDARDGWAMLLPETTQSHNDDAPWLIGSPDAHGQLNTTAGLAPVTPGQSNPRLDELHMPEPASLSLMLGPLAILTCRRAAGRKHRR